MSQEPAQTGLIVPTELAGERLDRVLADLMQVSRANASARIDAGDVTLGGRSARRSAKVAAGDVIVVSREQEADAPAAAPPAAPPIRWQDDHLLVVAKPAGMVVHAGAGHDGDTMVDALLAAGVTLAPAPDQPERPGIVHRLDRDTSGLLVVARTTEALAALGEALRRREVGRRYLALVQGTLPSLRGRIEAPIGRHPDDRKRFAVIAGGRPAVTHWEVAGSAEVGGRTVSLVGCRLETGRTHQLRVHLSGADCPVVGDLPYGASGSLAQELRLPRLFLHATRLAFDHPVTGERVDVIEPLPGDLADALDLAGLPEDLPTWATAADDA